MRRRSAAVIMPFLMLIACGRTRRALSESGAQAPVAAGVDGIGSASARVAPLASASASPPHITSIAGNTDHDGSGYTVEWANDGTARLRYAFSDIGSFRYVFWSAGWKWANAEVEKVDAPGALATFDIKVADLGITINLKVTQPEPEALVYEYTVTTSRALHGVVGGGLEFMLTTDSRAFAGGGKAPAVLPRGGGFSWEARPGETISVAFDPPVPEAYVEGGNKGQIRCFLVGKDAESGIRKYRATLRLPKGGTRRRSIAERYGTERGADWPAQTVTWDKWPIDVSFLNDGDRPSGKHGRVRAAGEDLVFEDGTPARFWGTNIQAYALFTGTKPAIANQAKRLAALGYNLVRITHHDSAWVTPNVFAAGETTQSLDDAALDNIDWWVKCLRDEGIYVLLDLKTGRTFRKGDQIEGFDEVARAEPTGRGFDYVDPRLEALEQRFAEQYLKRVNRYTGKSYVDDPTVMAVLVTNENDLTTHFGNLMAPDKGNPVHQKMFESRVKESASRLGVSPTDALRSWEPGPSKLAMADLEAQFFQRAVGQLRKMGYAGIVIPTTYWGDESLFSLPSLAVGDAIDVHAYGDPEFLGQNLHTDPNFVSYIAATSIGKPVIVTEWNVEYPKRDRFVAPLYVASIASLQGWDAPMLYGYLQSPVDAPGQPDSWSAGYDPALIALAPAAAVMFRQGHVRPASKTYRLDLDKRQLYYSATSPKTSAAIRTLAEQSKLVIGLPAIPELPWSNAAATPRTAGQTVITDPEQDFLPANQTFVTSDTGELVHDWALGIETIDTPKSQATAGWIGGRSVDLSDVRFQIRTPKATVAVTSLDGQPISQSHRMLVTVVAQVVASPGGRLPFLAQPVEGTISIRSPRSLKLTPLPSAGSAAAIKGLLAISGVRDHEMLTFEIPHGLATHWFLLTPAN